MRGMMAACTVCAICAMTAMTGCRSAATPSPARIEFDRMLVNAYTDSAITNAVITQHTIFPYQFVRNSGKLNELGQRDVGVLAAHFRQYPGPLNVRRGDASQELYDARVQEVKAALMNDGVGENTITINDAMPGGDGMTSERVLLVSQQEKTVETKRAYILSGSTKVVGAP